jgi:hypothetical protein
VGEDETQSFGEKLVCLECKMLESKHADGKCLYEPTTFILCRCFWCNGAITQRDVEEYRFATYVNTDGREEYRFHIKCVRAHGWRVND